jgi:hypothetical protein
MLGVGKKRSKSFNKSTHNYNKLMIVDNPTQMSLSKYELYFRAFFLIKYYNKLFDDINRKLKAKYNGKSHYYIYHFKPEVYEPEGMLF